MAIGEADTQRQIEKDYNLRIADLQFNLSATSGFIWDSNFERNSDETEDSFILSPTLFIQAYWPISPYIVLSTGAAVGYEYYLEGNGRDGLIVRGYGEDSSSSFNLDISLSDDSVITFSNNFSANISSASTVTNDGQRQNQPFRRFTNTNSLRYEHRITPQTRISFDYGFRDIFARSVTVRDSSEDTGLASSGGLDSIESQRHKISGEISDQLTDSLTLSLTSDFSSTLYKEDFRNDFDQFTSGPKITYNISPNITSFVQLAVNYLAADGTNSRATTATTENKSLDLILRSVVTFTAGNYWAHGFFLYYLQEPSDAITFTAGSGEPIPVNFQEITFFVYQLNYLFYKNLNVSFYYLIERTIEAGDANRYKIEEISAELPFRPNERTVISARYTHSKIFGSRFEEFNSKRHRVEINFRLNF